MPVFFKGSKRVLFVHVPKAGGTSIEHFFAANGFATHYLDRGGAPDSLNPVRNCSPQHMPADTLRSLFTVKKFDYVFMTVRHPLQRLLSKYVMENPGARNADRVESWIFQDFAKVFADPGHMDNHLRPQSDFFLPEAEVFKLEDGFGTGFVEKLEQRIGVTWVHRTVGREMQAAGGGLNADILRPGVRTMLETYYARDYTAFGYAT